MDKQDETAQEAMQRIVDEARNAKRVPSDPDRDTSGDSVYKPRKVEAWETINTPMDLRDPVGPDSPVTINGYQTVQVMPLSQYNPEEDLLIINVAVGKMRPDRARAQVKFVKDEMDPWFKDLGWKHILYVPITYDHPMHRQFRTVNVVDLHGMTDSEQRDVLDKIRDQLGPLGGPDAKHIPGRDILNGDLPGAISDEE